MHRQWTLCRRLVLALVLTVSAIGVGLAQQAPPPARGGGPPGNFASFFTGKVTVGQTTEMRMSRIRFEAGARTNWHTHTTGQLLLVEEGKGRLQEEGSAFVDIPAGQSVYTKPNLRHWHGAAPDSHAVQFSVYSGDLTWMEAVSDDSYK